MGNKEGIRGIKVEIHHQGPTDGLANWTSLGVYRRAGKLGSHWGPKESWQTGLSLAAQDYGGGSKQLVILT